MTTLDEPSCLMNFKVGKYLTNGDEYRLFMQKLLLHEMNEIETVHLIFQFFLNTITDCGVVSKGEALHRIAESCDAINEFPDHLKNAIIDSYNEYIEPEDTAYVAENK
jgi:hypothetical protein